MLLFCQSAVFGGKQSTSETSSDDNFDVDRDEVICFALYTVSDNIMKLTAQLYPLKDGEDRWVRLELKQNGRWKQAAMTKVIEDGWTAPFRIERWDDTKDVPYRVRHGKKASYEGLIRRNPADKQEIVVAAFTGNSVSASHGGDISRDDIVENVKAIDVDLLFFSGDQVYNHNQHYKYWLKFGRDFGEIIKDRPTVTIPDDHDAGQPNLWGESGKAAQLRGASDGGYLQTVEYVKAVERAQTSHLPDPYDPTPIKRGIGVYYTDLNWGRISFAILEDRKFKTGPAGIVPEMGKRPDHITDPDYEPRTVDVPEAVLLGDRQLAFLDDWAQDYAGADMKVALSQTIFCGGAHIHGKVGGRLHADMDSNGWPQAGRNRAIVALRKTFAFHLAGDQHLATIFHHGVNDWRDSIVSFCVPSIANLYLRWWDPIAEGLNRNPGDPPYLGDHYDGFDNMVTCYAVANPSKEHSDGGKLNTRAAGFGIVKLNKNTRKITMECWPRNVDITDPKIKPYPGWPRTIDQTDNYGRKPSAYLPTIKVKGQRAPVVQIVDESDGSIVYTIRIKGSTFKPKVFREGAYTVRIGEGRTQKTFTGVESLPLDKEGTLEVRF
ncbi:MAG: hypothetical protein KAT00_06655 [Planctomycetes bacterium]|nr:hypothetical protein [Planctomycetota bacterium]